MNGRLTACECTSGNGEWARTLGPQNRASSPVPESWGLPLGSWCAQQQKRAFGPGLYLEGLLLPIPRGMAFTLGHGKLSLAFWEPP